jgi:DNA-directed RNA polymerase specialized sigma24 family protein
MTGMPHTGRTEDLFRQVYAEQFAVLVRLAYLTTGSRPTAEDLVQDVFLKLHQHWHHSEAHRNGQPPHR